jgi:hypothetical protein
MEAAHKTRRDPCDCGNRGADATRDGVPAKLDTAVAAAPGSVRP